MGGKEEKRSGGSGVALVAGELLVTPSSGKSSKSHSKVAHIDSLPPFENHHTIQFAQSSKTKNPHLLLVQIELGHSSLMLVISRPERQRDVMEITTENASTV